MKSLSIQNSSTGKSIQIDAEHHIEIQKTNFFNNKFKAKLNNKEFTLKRSSIFNKSLFLYNSQNEEIGKVKMNDLFGRIDLELTGNNIFRWKNQLFSLHPKFQQMGESVMVLKKDEVLIAEELKPDQVALLLFSGLSLQAYFRKSRILSLVIIAFVFLRYYNKTTH